MIEKVLLFEEVSNNNIFRIFKVFIDSCYLFFNFAISTFWIWQNLVDSKTKFRFKERQFLAILGWSIFTEARCSICSLMWIYHEVLTKQLDSLRQNRNRDLREHFHCRILAKYKRSLQVFVNSTSIIMRSILNQSFLCFPSISIDTLVYTQQWLENNFQC